MQTMVAHAIGNYHNSAEYEFYRHRQKDIEEILSNTLLEDQKQLVDQVLLELESRGDRETEVVYRQGLCDSAAILKRLGVLA